MTAQTDNGNTWYFRYDGDTPIGLEFDGVEYYYVTNLQGDVIAILNDSGECVAEYSYDAWGNCTVTKATDTIAYDNPLRYRGYYYDFDSGLYYLQSRFYDANTGRFINADEPTLIGANGGVVSNNLFAYCDNNPVNCDDAVGTASRKTKKLNNYYIVYWRSYNNNFNEQATFMLQHKYSSKRNHIFLYVRSKSDFKNRWSSMTNIGDVYLYLHGGAGKLYFDGDTMYESELYFLANKKISGKVYLLSCDGGTDKNGWSVASRLALKVGGHRVRAAVNGSVYYRAWYQLFDRWPLTKGSNSYWADFYIKHGKKVTHIYREYVGGKGRMPIW